MGRHGRIYAGMLGALLIGAAFVFSTAYVKAHKTNAFASAQWSARAAGIGTVVPACGSSAASVTCSGGSPSVTITWTDGTNYCAASPPDTVKIIINGTVVAKVPCDAFTYTWTGGAFGTTYTYSVYDPAIADTIGSGSFTTPASCLPPINVTPTATPTSGTGPFPVSFSGTISGGSGSYTKFAWDFGDGTSVSGPTLDQTHTYAAVAFTRKYGVVLTVTDSAGDVGNGWILITDNPTSTPPQIIITTSPSSFISQGNSTTITVAITGVDAGGSCVYTSSPTDTSSSWDSETSTSFASVPVSPVKTTTYTVTCTNSDGSTGSGSIRIIVSVIKEGGP